MQRRSFLGFWKTEVNLWIEKELSFRKFWSKDDTHINRIANTDEAELKKLQKFIYDGSEGNYTICDLQGEKLDGKYILADIEYTNTLQKFNMSASQLLESYKQRLKDESWKIVNFLSNLIPKK